MANIYETLKIRAHDVCADILDERIIVRARAHTTEEAIGNPEADDFPIQKGRERLMQAEFGKGIGQAFTDRYGDFEGTFKDILEMPMTNNYRRAIFVAALNAVLNHRGLIEGTIHCRDQEPMQCARELADYIRDRSGDVKIGLAGFQPRMAEVLGAGFPIRLLDLDPDNICATKFGITVEGEESTDDVIAWADLLLVTGTTLVNNTIETFLGKKPVIFYGTTIAGAAHLMGWERFCACST